MNLIEIDNKPETALAISKPETSDEMVVYAGSGGITNRSRGQAIQVRSKVLKISGKNHTVDPYQLMRMIKQTTQTIGEYKERDNPYASYIIAALRKARGDIASDLESHFRIHWEIDQMSGNSVFYM